MSEAFRHQFCVTTDEDDLVFPSHFNVSHLAGYRIATCPSLPVVNLVSTEGSCIGLILGWPVQYTALLEHSIQLPRQADTDWLAIERWLYDLAGRWIAIISLADTQRVYMDTLASQSTVYLPALRRLASTPGLIAATPAPLLSVAELVDKDYWYPAGLTGYTGAFRLLANHYLELNTFCCKRHWPRPDSDITASDNWQDDIPQVARLIQHQFTALSLQIPLRVGLTAGLESRVMLACSRDTDPAPLFWTRSDKSLSQYQDIKTASVLASRFSIKHLIVLFKAEFNCSEAEINQFLAATGYCVGGTPLKSHKLISSAGACFAFTGIGGEIARAYYKADNTGAELSGQTLLQLTGLPALPQFIEATNRYAATLPKLAVQQQLALFYLENRVSAFGAVHRYAYQSGIVLLSPFSHRSIVSCMLKVPLAAQLDAQFHKALIKYCWPDLLSVPFNAPLGLEDKIYMLYKRLVRLMRKANR